MAVEQTLFDVNCQNKSYRPFHLFLIEANKATASNMNEESKGS
jgi:hypothetical protein